MGLFDKLIGNSNDTFEAKISELNKELQEKDNEKLKLLDKIEQLEKQVAVYEETVSTIRAAKISKDEQLYIEHQLRTLAVAKLVNSCASEQRISTENQENEVTAKREAQIRAKQKIAKAIEEEKQAQKNSSEIERKNFAYEKYDKGIRITAYIGFNKEETLIIPDTIDGLPVVAIGRDAFKNMVIKSVKIPQSVEKLEWYAFMGCKNLKNVKLPERLQILDTGCFSDCGLENISIPGSVKEIGISCFRGCESLSSVELNEGLECIDTSAFEDTPITKVVIPKSIKKIGKEAFQKERRMERHMEAAFLGTGKLTLEDSAFGRIFTGRGFANNATLYCLPQSDIVRIAREQYYDVKELKEFEM